MNKRLWLFWLLVPGIGCFGEDLALEKAIPAAFAYVRERIPDGSTVSVQAVESDDPKPGTYIYQEWLTLAVNDSALSVVEGQNPGDFSIAGSFETFGASYILRVRLVKADTDRILAQGRFDIARSPLLANLLGYREPAALPERKPAPASSYEDDSVFSFTDPHWLTFGIGFVMNFITMTGEPLLKSYGYANYEDPQPFGMGVTVMLSVQLFKYFAIQADVTYTWNTLEDSEFWGAFNDNRLQTALLAKLTLDLLGIFGIEPFVGAYVDFPSGSLHYALGKDPRGGYWIIDSTAYSIQPGFVAGLRLYSWLVFADYRFGFDFNPTSVDAFNGQSGDLYRRCFFTITLGLQWGAIKKKR